MSRFDLPFARYSRSNGFLEAQKPTPLPFLVSHLVTPKMSSSKGETMRPGPICAVVQNFTSIGFTVAEISVTEQIDLYNARNNYSRLQKAY